MMPAEPDDKSPSHDGEEFDLSEMAYRATDPFWHALTGMCGGCGNASCHEGRCPGNVGGYCTTCPTRRATGEVR